MYGYLGGKVTDDGFHARPRAWDASHPLVQAAQRARFGPELSGRVHFKPVTAGEVVLNSRSSTLSEQLKHHYNDAVAIEMESAGVAQAAHLTGSLHTLTIRGISDKADGQKHTADASGSQQRAAANAAAAAVAVLAEIKSRKGVTGKDVSYRSPGPVPVATSSLPAEPSAFSGHSAEVVALLDALRPTPDRGRTRRLLAAAFLFGFGNSCTSAGPASSLRDALAFDTDSCSAAMRSSTGAGCSGSGTSGRGLSPRLASMICAMASV
nr:hypothetical protein [Streptomyces echinatus]